jgi:benzoyl-CoA reductase/2-hydroxyglutaryl-CoA dehydratase subunit BcrC/BadD/HgdB
VVGETTCDGKKKAYEVLAEIKDTLVIEVPHMKSQEGRKLWLSEVHRLKGEIEERSGRAITADRLKDAIRTVNAKRRALQRLSRLREAKPSPISGLDALLINQVQFYDDPRRLTEQITALCEELEGRVADKVGATPNGAPRILVSGCPMAAPNWKVPFVVEKSGASIVAEESCVGERNTRNLVSEEGATVDEMLGNIAVRYLEIDCACFTPNPERVEHIVELARRFEVDGVIHYSLQFCAPYTTEEYMVEKALENERIPLLRLETDYSMEDVAQLETRVQAFLEVIGE